MKVIFLNADWSVCHAWLVVALTGRSLRTVRRALNGCFRFDRCLTDQDGPSLSGMVINQTSCTIDWFSGLCKRSVYAVLVYRESFPVAVADGALCWSAEVTAQHHRITGSLYSTECGQKTSRPRGWVMAFNNTHICDQFINAHWLSCHRVSWHVWTHDQLMRHIHVMLYIIPLTEDVFCV